MPNLDPCGSSSWRSARGSCPAVALAEPVDFAIPAESADRALLAFSKQAGMEVFFPFDALRQARTPAVAGRYERDQALGLLLTGNGLRRPPERPRGLRHHGAAPAPANPTGPEAALPRAESRSPPPPKAAPPTSNPTWSRAVPRPALALRKWPKTSTGDVDLLRTENDALPFEVYSRARIATSGAVNLEDFSPPGSPGERCGQPAPGRTGRAQRLL